jgi:N-methylhydantoinase A
VTDANVVLGYMNPESIAGSTLRIDREAAWTAIKNKLANPLGLEVLQTAYGIVQVANATMMRALRAVSTERGRDPREFTLVAFGGAGPIHAAELAASLGIRQVYVPLYPGLFSALGLLLADFRHDYVRSVALALEAIDPETILRRYAELEELARTELIQEGIPATAVRCERQVDLKYGYQISELTLPFPADGDSADLRTLLAQLFTEAHQQAFGYSRDDQIEVVSLRLRATAKATHLQFAELARHGSTPERATSAASVRQAYFGPRHGLQTAPIRQRDDISAAEPGPLIVEEPDTTVVVPPGWTIQRDATGNLVLRA